MQHLHMIGLMALINIIVLGGLPTPASAQLEATAKAQIHIDPELPTLLSGPLIPPSTAIQAMYGPTGPTIESVRKFLRFRLWVIGNPRLKVGPTHEDATTVFVSIITYDNSLVEEYAVDKKTRRWEPIH